MSLYPDHGSSLWHPPAIPAPRPIVPAVPVVPPKPKSCNRHDDCNAAEIKSFGKLGYQPNFHCNDSDCEDCFPK